MSIFSKSNTGETVRIPEACRRAGISPRHLLGLAIEGRLEPTDDGGITAVSLERFILDRDRRIAMGRSR